MMPGEVHTVRGVTGTVKELMYAFGVQVGWACVRTRRSNYGWSMEKCLLYRGYKPPLYANNPRPIIRNGEPLTHWELAREAAEQRFDCSLREILIALVASGASSEDIKRVTNLKLTPQHYEGLVRRVSAIQRAKEQIV